MKLEKSDKIDIPLKDERQVQKQLKHIGALKFHKGHTVFRLDVDSGAITPAQYETSALKSSFGYKTVRKVVMQQRSLYCSALNPENARKKFTKMLSN
jgi:hypothetical protein